ncbi:MAG: 6-deoxy-6-sulfogluconolactonase [Paracidovorax wautersii]|uniref:6-deoxy-6-sulfogluconolactonase n=1 Tax=Paracidovorax wautersii TaxID=1177982 RepID=A0A7V8FMU5_9BURK|nr:MAG: 6-deoxy-6-sulfogluconolactonase [Paracidovorax wautersii]
MADAARRIGAHLQAHAVPTGEAELRPVPGPWAFEGGQLGWHAGSGRLYWADRLAPALRTVQVEGPAPAEDRLVAQLEHPVAGLLVREQGLLLVEDVQEQAQEQPQGQTPAQEHADTPPSGRAWVLTLEGRRESSLPWPAGVLQALCEDPQGQVWAAMETVGGSAVGRVLAHGRFEVRWHLGEALQCLRWHPAEDALYATAPASGSILVLQPRQQGVRRLATLPKGSGRPAGLAFDAEGGVWTALREGWSVVRLLAGGSLDRVIGLPVPCPCDVALGGADGRQLFIATSRQSVPLDTLASAPLSGRLFQFAL